MLTVQNITYFHPDKDLLFDNVNLAIHEKDKIALIGNNGSGKSTLMRILAGTITPSAGSVRSEEIPYHIPQIFGQFNQYTIAQALKIEDKLKALEAILTGDATGEHIEVLDDDWTIEERCQEALAYWQLHGLDLTQTMDALSGGQKTKVFLAGIIIHQPKLVLLDEPSNHLDMLSRSLLYEYISSTANTLVVVSHDRTLLNLLEKVFELSNRGITVYGGNYNFYAEQKIIENNALDLDVKNREKELRKAKEVERESLARQQKLDARGKKKQEKAGLPTISMNTFRNNAEKSTSRIKDVHAEKVGAIAQELSHLRRELPDVDKIKMGFYESGLHIGKILFTAEGINFGYNNQFLWKQSLNIQILSGERIVIKGSNGSGKTTLIKIILGDLSPQSGILQRADIQAIYIDQDYSLINDRLSVYEQAQQLNSGQFQEHEVKIRLNRFLFGKNDWDKPCKSLSGGEKMRLILCCLTIRNQAPDMIILDEPTNNLDIQNIEILTAAVNDYKGTLLVVTHDAMFLEQINVLRVIDLDLWK